MSVAAFIRDFVSRFVGPVNAAQSGSANASTDDGSSPLDGGAGDNNNNSSGGAGPANSSTTIYEEVGDGRLARVRQELESAGVALARARADQQRLRDESESAQTILVPRSSTKPASYDVPRMMGAHAGRAVHGRGYDHPLAGMRRMPASMVAGVRFASPVSSPQFLSAASQPYGLNAPAPGAVSWPRIRPPVPTRATSTLSSSQLQPMLPLPVPHQTASAASVPQQSALAGFSRMALVSSVSLPCFWVVVF